MRRLVVDDGVSAPPKATRGGHKLRRSVVAAGTEVGAAAARISAIVAREPGACWKPRDEPRIVAARQQRSRAGSGKLRNEAP